MRQPILRLLSYFLLWNLYVIYCYYPVGRRCSQWACLQAVPRQPEVKLLRALKTNHIFFHTRARFIQWKSSPQQSSQAHILHTYYYYRPCSFSKTRNSQGPGLDKIRLALDNVSFWKRSRVELRYVCLTGLVRRRLPLNKLLLCVRTKWFFFRANDSLPWPCLKARLYKSLISWG